MIMFRNANQCLFRTSLAAVTIAFSLLTPIATSAGYMARVEGATVFITAKYRPISTSQPSAKDLVAATGTGFVVSEDGLILTNAHVVESVMELDARTGRSATDKTPIKARRIFVLHTVSVRFHSGTEHSKVHTATVLATLEPRPLVDLALLRVYPKDRLTTVPMASMDTMKQLKRGHEVRSVGFPQALNFGNPNGPELVLHKGDIAAPHLGKDGSLVAINHDAKIDHGNSGGPLIDGKGRVVGINTFGKGKQDFAIPVDTIRREFGDVLKHRTKSDGRILTVGHGDARDGYSSLTEAMKAARPGDTVFLDEGRHETDSVIKVKPGVWLRGVGRRRTTLALKSSNARVELGNSGYSELSDMTIVLAEKVQRYPNGCLVWCKGGSQTYIHDIDVINDCTPYVRVLVGERDNAPNIYNCRIESPRYPSSAIAVKESNDGDAFSFAKGEGPQFHRVQFSGAVLWGKAAFKGAIILPADALKEDGVKDEHTHDPIMDSAQNELTMVGCLWQRRKVKGGDGDLKIANGLLRANVFHFAYGFAVKEEDYRNPFVRIGSAKHQKLKIIGNHFICTGYRPKWFRPLGPGKGSELLGLRTGWAISIATENKTDIANNYFWGCQPDYAFGHKKWQQQVFPPSSASGNVFVNPTKPLK